MSAPSAPVRKLLPDTFPCSGCGACCRRIDMVVKNFGEGTKDKDSELYFPYTWNEKGHCSMLTEDNRCSVYEDRPLICNVDGLRKHFSLPKEALYEESIEACNIMMDQDDVPQKFRIT